MRISVVVPSNRPDNLQEFILAWHDLFTKHNVKFYPVIDGDDPHVIFDCKAYYLKEIMGHGYADLIFNKNDGVRNLGFALAYQHGADVIISLDDDVRPIKDTDPIQDHLDVLNTKVPVSWMNTAIGGIYMRGVPYGVRDEAQVVLSHGTWEGVADFDASTQLVFGTPPINTHMMPIPKGVLFPMCIMNVAFKREMTPFMYQAPMFGDVNRFADIWSGIEAKKEIDARGWAAVTGYSVIRHDRASNPFANLVKEARGVGMNEKYGEGEYFEMYKANRTRWQEFLTK